MSEPTAQAPADVHLDTGSGAPDTPAPAGSAQAGPPPPLVEDELLVEDVSIDGMCGVY
jgi:mycofactocin precursor